MSQQLTFEKVKDSIRSIMDHEEVPGISLAIISKQNNLNWSGGLGVADIAQGKPMSDHTTMFVASLSKNILALGMMILTERGQLDLKQPIVELIPEINFKNQWSTTHPITVEMVLEHTTGFDDMRYNNFIGEDDLILPLEELLNRYPEGLESRWKPGTMFSYSNLNYTVAGNIIEKVSGKPFEEFIDDEIIQPLEMNDTRLSGFTEKFPGLAIPYSYDYSEQKIVPFFSDGSVGKNFMQRPASFLTTSSSDMLKILEMYLSNGDSLVSTESITRMENGETGYHSILNLPGRYGLGNKPGLREVRLFGHSGQAWNNAFLMYNREEQIGYYLATNCDYPIPGIRRLLNQFLLQHKEVPGSKESSVSYDIVKPFEGFYEVVNSRNQLMLFFEKFRFAGYLKVTNDGIHFDGGLKQRNYEVLDGSSSEKIVMERTDPGFEKRKGKASLGIIKDENNEPLIVWDAGNSMYYFRPQSSFVHYFKKIGLFGSIIILMLGTILVLIRSIIKIFKRNFSFSLYDAVFMSGVMCLAVIIYIFIPTGPFDQISKGQFNLKTATFFVTSGLYPLLTLSILILVLRNRSMAKRIQFIFQMISLCAMIFITGFLISNNLVGFRYWLY